MSHSLYCDIEVYLIIVLPIPGEVGVDWKMFSVLLGQGVKNTDLRDSHATIQHSHNSQL